MAFAPSGNLYTVSTTGQVAYLTKDQVAAAWNGQPVTWNLGVKLENSYAVNGQVQISARDIAFDGAGNMWMAYSVFNNSGTSRIGSVPESTLLGTGTAKVTEKATLAQRGSRGLAFMGDTLYLAVGNSTFTTTSLYTVAWNQPTVTIDLISASYERLSVTNAVSDLASCSFPGEVIPPVGPAFQVQKSVINPDGSIAPAGTTGAPAVSVKPDGSFEVQYLVTVSNVGNQEGVAPDITDTFTVPSGFAVTGVTLTPQGGTATAVTSPFVISPGTLYPQGSTDPAKPVFKTYLVTVSLKTNNPTPADWQNIGTCNTAGAGTPGTGLFNRVVMANDADGADNNDACLPVGNGHLSLVKQIVDQNGALVTSTDSAVFTLVAAGPTPLSGSSPTSGATAASGIVLPGTYTLHEMANDGGATSNNYRLYADWSCTNNGAALAVTGSQITVNNGDNVTCVIQNTLRPKVHVVKTAASPTTNPHIGQTVTVKPDGTFTADYVVTVTNASSFPITTGPVTDGFLLPAGLAWDGDKSATVAYADHGTGADAADVPATLAETQLVNAWATLASSIANLPAGASVSFHLSIPLALDQTLTPDGTQTLWQLHEESLATCESKTSAGGNAYTTFASGIPNMTSIASEDLTYSDIAVEDNVACVPVQVPKLHVVKDAANPIAGNTHVGQTITPAADGTFTARYTITLTNTSEFTASSGPVTDHFTVPAGLLWDGAKTATVRFAPGTTGATATNASGEVSVLALTQAELAAPGGATLTTSVANIPAGASVRFTIDIPLVVDLTVSATGETNFGANQASLGSCASLSSPVDGAYTDTSLGIPNVVSLAGEDQTYNTIPTEDNVACVSVEAPPRVIHVEKLGVNCDTDQPTCPLPGAEYQIFDTDPSAVPAPEPIPGGIAVDGADLSRFISVELTEGDYWLVETKSPEGFSLLATPIHFTLTVSGIVNVTGAELSPNDVFTLQVKDAPLAVLPAAGGSGPVPFAAVGLALIATGGLVSFKMSRPSRRSAA